MTHEQKIEYMRMAAAMVGFAIRERDLDFIVSTYELVLKKEGKTTVSDAVDVFHAVNERWKEEELKAPDVEEKKQD